MNDLATQARLFWKAAYYMRRCPNPHHVIARKSIQLLEHLYINAAEPIQKRAGNVLEEIHNGTIKHPSRAV